MADAHRCATPCTNPVPRPTEQGKGICMFSVVYRAMDNTLGPRDLRNCRKSTRIWTSKGWVVDQSNLAECKNLRARRDFDLTIENLNPDVDMDVGG